MFRQMRLVRRKALAMGADRAVRIDAKPDSSASTAKALADYFKSEPYDLILTGLESSDFNGGITGITLKTLFQPFRATNHSTNW